MRTMILVIACFILAVSAWAKPTISDVDGDGVKETISYSQAKVGDVTYGRLKIERNKKLVFEYSYDLCYSTYKIMECDDRFKGQEIVTIVRNDEADKLEKVSASVIIYCWDGKIGKPQAYWSYLGTGTYDAAHMLDVLKEFAAERPRMIKMWAKAIDFVKAIQAGNMVAAEKLTACANGAPAGDNDTISQMKIAFPVGMAARFKRMPDPREWIVEKSYPETTVFRVAANNEVTTIVVSDVGICRCFPGMGE